MFNLSGVEAGVMFIQASMPSAVLTFLVSEIYSPVSGTILEFNMSLEDAPEQLNQSPYQDGWIAKIKPHNLDDIDNLLDAEAYSNVVGE